MRDRRVFSMLLIAALIGLLCTVSAASASSTDVWWNSSWNYRVEITVNTSSYNRTDWPIEVYKNFTAELEYMGETGTFDENSTRVIEYDTSTGLPMYEVKSQFDEGWGHWGYNASIYDAASSAVGQVTWLLNGTRPEHAEYKFYIYFDIIENGKKEYPNYPTSLDYAEGVGTNGEEFWFNTSKVNVRVDTGANGRANYTSGIYQVELLDSSTVLFNVPDGGGSTVEFVKYLREINAVEKEVMFNFRNRYNLTVSGPVRRVIEQVGEEEIWGDMGNTTGEGSMTKRYIFYDDNQWIKIQQVFTNSLATPIVIKSPVGPNALRVELNRAWGDTGAPPPIINGSGTNPYSWYSQYVAGDKGATVINLNQTGTDKYVADNKVGPDVLGIRLDGLNVDGKASISETAVLYFYNQSSWQPGTELRSRFADDCNKTQKDPEARRLIVAAQTGHDIYNRMEVINFSANVTLDTHDLNSSANATLVYSNGTAINLTLYDNGVDGGDSIAGDGVYSNNITIYPKDPTGEWNLTVRVYDSTDYFLNQSVKYFNVTDEYDVSIAIENTYGVIERMVIADVFVYNYRNDVGIGNTTGNATGYNFSCEYNGTEVVNITDWYNGTYTINFTAPSIADTYNLTCNSSKYNNSGFDVAEFYTSYVFNTTLAVNLTPDTYVVYNITQEENQSFEMIINVTNIGEGDAYQTNISLNATYLNTYFVPNITFPYNCPILTPTASCVAYFNVTVKDKTPPGVYQLNSTVVWENLDKNVSNTTDVSNITVAENPILYVAETELSANISHGGELQIGNFTINATGNYRLENVSLACVSGNACTDPDLSIEMLPDFTTIIDAGENQTVRVNVTVNLGTSPGTYNGTLNISCDNANFDLVNISITVPTSTTWYMTPSYPTISNMTVRVNETGDIVTLVINNTGNVQINFNITPAVLTNYSEPDNQQFDVSKQDTHDLVIRYNTSGAPLGSIATAYIVNATTINATPSETNITVNLTIVFGQELNITQIPEYSEQGENVSITINVTDNGGAGIKWVKANITRYDGFVDYVDFTNITEVREEFWTSSLWSVNYTNATARGNYTLVIYSLDNADGYGSAESNFTVYAKLVLNINPLSNSYQQGDTGTFRINLTDINGDATAGASANVLIRDPSGWLISNITTTTGADGTVQPGPTFTLSSEATSGSYAWTSNVSYYDAISGQMVNGSTSNTFSVATEALGLPLYLDIDVGESYNPGDVAHVYAIVKDRYGVIVSGANVVINVTNSSGAVIESLIASEIAGPAYKANFTLASDADYGTYSVLGKATYLGDTGYDADVFSISEPPATALPLSVEVHVNDISSPGTNVSIYAVVTDQDGAPVSGSSVIFNVTDPSGTIIQNLSALEVSGPSYRANFSLASDATYGPYMVFAKAMNQSYTAYDTAMFYVAGDMHAEMTIPSVVYREKMMTVSVIALDPASGLSLDPDEINVSIYRTEGYNLDSWRTLNKSSFTKEEEGFYTYSELIDSGVLTGSYLAVSDIRKDSLRDWDMVAFRILMTGPYDVEIPWITSPISSGGDLTFTINMTNMGEGGQDVNVSYQIVGQNYSASESKLAKPTGVPDAFNRSFSNVDLPNGTYNLAVSVTYDPSTAPAIATTTFQIEDVGPGPTPPPTEPPAGPGGGGGGAGVPGVEGIPKPELIVPTEVPINEPFRFKFEVECEDCNIADLVDYIRYVIYPKGETAPRERVRLEYPFEAPLDLKYVVGDELKVSYTVKFKGYADTVGIGVFEVAPPIAKGGFLNITDVYPARLNVEKDKSGYITVTTENTGETALHNVVVSLEGVPLEWIETMRGEKDVLLPGDVLNTLIKINVPLEVESETYTAKIRSIADENGDERSATIKVFESTCDLVAFEMINTRRRMRTVQTDYLEAINEGKEVSAVAPMMDDAAEEMDNGEMLLQDGYCVEAEGSNTEVNKMLDVVDVMLKQAALPVVKEEVPEEVGPPPTLLESLPLRWILIIGVFLLILVLILALIYLLTRRRQKMKEEKAIFMPRAAVPGRPVVKIPEVGTLEYTSELKMKKEKVEKLLATIKDQHNKGLISERTYIEIKKKNEEKLYELDTKIKGMK